MAAFQIIFEATQSASGQVITMQDSSDYSTNTEGYVRSDFTRQFVLTDYAGDVLDTITLDDTTDIATYELTTDLYISIELSLTGIATYSLTQDYPFMRITATKLQTALQSGCCSGKTKSKALNEAVNFIVAAQFAAPTTDHSAFQNNIAAANLFLDTIV